MHDAVIQPIAQPYEGDNQGRAAHAAAASFLVLFYNFILPW